MTRMFRTVTKTWNPYVGCYYDCVYCWARDLALGRLRNSPRYQHGFEPQFIERELNRRFRSGVFVFVSSMGDLFGHWVPIEWILKILQRIAQFPETNFLLQTKNPMRFCQFYNLPENVFLGTTIETNRYSTYNFSKAPNPDVRHWWLSRIEHPHKFLSIEPIMDFDLGIMLDWVRDIQPEIIEVGADNYGHNLPEPSWGKVCELIRHLHVLCPHVEEKEGLGRLKETNIPERR